MSWLAQMRAPSLAVHPGAAPAAQRPAQPFPEVFFHGTLCTEGVHKSP